MLRITGSFVWPRRCHTVCSFGTSKVWFVLVCVQSCRITSAASILLRTSVRQRIGDRILSKTNAEDPVLAYPCEVYAVSDIKSATSQEELMQSVTKSANQRFLQTELCRPAQLSKFVSSSTHAVPCWYTIQSMLSTRFKAVLIMLGSHMSQCSTSNNTNASRGQCATRP